MNSRHIRAMLQQTFQRKAVILVPECNWTGHECDVLVVHDSLRIIDIEIKVSRADFKRDAAKDKWWIGHRWFIDGPQAPRQWPPKVWKHYFAMPASVWKPDLEEFLPSPACGVIVLHDKRQQIVAEVVRRAKPNAAAEKIDSKACIDLARLAGLRMWDALAEREPPPVKPEEEPLGDDVPLWIAV